MHSQVVQHEEDFLRGATNQALHEVDQAVGIERAVEDLPTHLARVGHCGDHRLAVPLVVHPNDRRLPLARIAAATHVVAAQAALVAQ